MAECFAMLLFDFSTPWSSWWLKCYTRHGQSIELPDFIGKNFESQSELLQSMIFELVKIDSVFKVDQPGSIIFAAKSIARLTCEKIAKVYLVVTKAHGRPDTTLCITKIVWSELWIKKCWIKKKGFWYYYDDCRIHLRCRTGQLHYGVIYQGDTLLNNKIERLDYSIPKGGTLGMILSKIRELTSVYNVVCMNYTAAAFLLNSLGLVVDEIEEDVLNNKNESYVTHQEPLFDADYSIKSGDTVHIYLNSKNRRIVNENQWRYRCRTIERIARSAKDFYLSM